MIVTRCHEVADDGVDMSLVRLALKLTVATHASRSRGFGGSCELGRSL